MKGIFMQHWRVFFLCVCLCMFFPSVMPSFAQIADEPCDEQYFNSLKARAWLEAQREITQNQNLIFKPDSVLEYTCFDKYGHELAEHALDMFSETQRWGTILADDHMDNALENLVGPPLRDFLENNFQHKFLGGRLDQSLNPGHQNMDYPPEDGVWGNVPYDRIYGEDKNGAYGYKDCDRMNEVWLEAKCMAFIDNEDEDGFFTFEQYASSPDHRFLPARCSGVGGEWGTNTGTAYQNVPWAEDNVQTYLDQLRAASCGNYDPVPTGLVIRDRNLPNGAAPEYVCIQPGCHYSPFEDACCSYNPSSGEEVCN